MAKKPKNDSEKDYGDDFVVITDEDGQEYELELLDTLLLDGNEYREYLPVSDGDEVYEMIYFRVVEEDGEELRELIEDEDERERVDEAFMERLFNEE